MTTTISRMTSSSLKHDIKPVSYNNEAISHNSEQTSEKGTVISFLFLQIKTPRRFSVHYESFVMMVIDLSTTMGARCVHPTKGGVVRSSYVYFKRA